MAEWSALRTTMHSNSGSIPRKVKPFFEQNIIELNLNFELN